MKNSRGFLKKVCLQPPSLSPPCLFFFFGIAQSKKGMYFSFDFGWYSIHLDIVLFVIEQGVGGLLNRQNLIIMKKVR